MVSNEIFFGFQVDPPVWWYDPFSHLSTRILLQYATNDKKGKHNTPQDRGTQARPRNMKTICRIVDSMISVPAMKIHFDLVVLSLKIYDEVAQSVAT